MDNIPAQPPVVQPIPSPVKEEHSPLNVEYEQPKGFFGRIFDYSSWIVLFLFAPFTVAIFLSQNSIPGDIMYPVKLGLENLVLAGASLHPSTRAMFHANISGRRFTEAETLLLTRSDTTGLQTFIDQIETTQIAINTISDPKEKERLEQELVVKITEYQTKLVEVKTKAAEQQIIGMVPQRSSQIPDVANPTVAVSIPTDTPTPTFTPTPTSIPTPTPIPVSNTNQKTGVTPTPVPTSTPTPTATPIPTPIPSPTPVPSTGGGTIGGHIDKTQEDLARIKKEIEERKQRELEKQKQEQAERLQREEDRRLREQAKEEEKRQQRKEREEKREKSSEREDDDQDDD